MKTMRANTKRKTVVPGPVLGYEDGIPIVPVTVKRVPNGYRRQVTLLKLAVCPYCGRPHTHGAGSPETDPHDDEGHRLSHCVDTHVPPERRRDMNRGYILRIVGEEPEPDPAEGYSPARRRLLADIERSGGRPAVLKRLENGETVTEIARSFNVSRQLLAYVLWVA
jgi:hypothetical protein